MTLPQIDILLNGFGTAYAGGSAYVYYAGTTTLATIYTDAAGTIPAANPVTLDVAGKATVYCGKRIKVDVKNSAGVSAVGFPVDNIGYGVIAPDVYMADAYASISEAVAAIGNAQTTLYVPAGSYAISNDLTIPSTLKLDMDNGAILVISSGKTLALNGAFAAGLFQCFGGSGSVVFSTGSVAEVYPEWWGSDYTALSKALSAGAVSLSSGKTYTLSNTATSTGNVVIKGNGAIIKSGAGFSASAQKVLVTNNNVLSTGTPTPFNVTAGASSFTIPAGMAVSVGNMVELYNTTTTSVGSYYDGQYVQITAINGSTAYTDTAFYTTFQVDAYKVYNNIVIDVSDVTFDLTNTATGDQSSFGVSFISPSILVKNCTFIGNDYAGAGGFLYGINVLVDGCTGYNFTNVQGEATGRTGYGMCVSGTNCVVRNSVFTNNKHNVTASAKSVMTLNLTYDGVVAHQDKSKYNTTVTPPTGSENYFGASLDVHANAINVNIVNCDVSGPNNLINIRNSYAKISQCNLRQTATTSTSVGLISGFERLWQNICVDNCKIVGSSTPVFLYYHGVAASEYITNISIIKSELSGISYPVHSSQLAGGTIHIDGVKVCDSVLYAPMQLWSKTNTSTASNIDIRDNKYIIDATTVTTTITGTVSGLDIVNNMFEDRAGAGGLHIIDYRNGTLTDMEFTSNKLIGSLTTYSSDSTTTTITNWNISSNTIDRKSGAACIGISLNATGTLNVSALKISHNILKVDSAGSGANSAIQFFNTPTLTTKASIIGNTMTTGGTATNPISGSTASMLAVGNLYFGTLGTFSAASTGNTTV